MSNRTLLVFALSVALSLMLSVSVLAQDETAAPQSGYASVNGLEMYYEIHGSGEPLVVLHGAYMAIPTLGEFVPRLAETRQVIVPELQGHGRTADVDRPITYEQMADDVAALLDELGIEKADFFGYSMGANTALQIAIRHPELVDKLIVASAAYTRDAYHPGFFEMLDTITPELFAGSPPEIDYTNLAPNPENFAVLVEKLVQLDREFEDWSPESIQSITAPTLLIFGDSDAVTPEHAIDMFRLRGGGINGDLTGLPNAQLAVLPATTHIGVLFRVDWVTSMVTEFLDAPLPPTE